MINQFEVPDYLAHQLPELSSEIPAGKKGNMYRYMRLFLNHTNNKLREHNFRALKRCFLLADDLYEQGNAVVKNTVENMFVFSFSQFFQYTKQEDKKELKEMIPTRLYDLYVNQVCHKGY